MGNVQEVVAQLHPLERNVLPHLTSSSTLDEITRKSGLKEVEAMRALQWLTNKNVLTLKPKSTESITLDENGKKAMLDGLPEKRFLKTLTDGRKQIKEIEKEAKLEGPEVNICLGILKSKLAVNIDPGMKISITDQGKNLLKADSLEEKFIRRLAEDPIIVDELEPEEKFAFDNLKKRKKIIKVVKKNSWTYALTDFGREVCNADLSDAGADKLTPDMLKKGTWKKKKFRAYDVKARVPAAKGGKTHFVTDAIRYAKRIWMDMGFEEMDGDIINTSFWNFDALFTAQDHPVRELQDTFYLKTPANGKIVDPKIKKRVKDAHETGKGCKSPGWQYKWNEDDAKKNVLRTHTTVLSAQYCAKLDNPPKKYFAVGRCYRNEAIDWSHLCEFNQTDGIVIDPDADFRHLLGYLKQFFTKMGFPEVRFRPAFFPYTEPSVEMDVYHPVHKKWIELGGAGIFRPEMVIPLFGKWIPVLAWGPGIDRTFMEYYGINDLRDLYKNDLKQIREMKKWMR